MNTFKRSLQYLSKYKWLAIGAFITMVTVTICGLVIPYFFEELIDEGITNKKLEVTQKISITLLVIAAVRAISSFCSTFWSQKASQGIAFDIRNQMYQKLEYLEFSFHDKHNIGQLITRTTSDVEALRNFFATGFLQIIAALITLLGSVSILLYTQWKLFLYILFIVPIIALVFFSMFKKLGPIFGRVQKNLGLLNNILQENILGIRIVKAFTAETQEHQRYEKQNQKIYTENLSVIKTFANSFPIIFFLSNIATLIVIWVGGTQVMDGKMSMGSLVAFNSYLTFLIQPIFQLGFIVQQFSRANASAIRIFSILDRNNSIISKPNAIPFQSNTKGTITFKDVCFSYTNNPKESVIKNINFTIQPGSTVAIIGPTGSGKSSIINLIPRFYDVTEGAVYINGKNVKEYEIDSLRQHIGVVLQDIRLQNDTIRENIRYGKLSATDEEINAVCKIAQVTNFLSNLEGGLDYRVGEGGKNLSGGQRQRVAIARMLLIQPKILIFDDASSALDAATEFSLKKELSPFLQSKEYTTIVISQKISTIKEADQILYIKNGTLIGAGNHNELVAQLPEYTALVASQQQTHE